MIANYHPGLARLEIGLDVTKSITELQDDVALDICLRLIETLDTLLARADDRTQFIPGHGPLCSKKELSAYKNLLTSIKDKVEVLHNQNRPLAEIIKKTQVLLDPKLHGVSREKFITQVYRMVKRTVLIRKILTVLGAKSRAKINKTLISH